MEESIIQYLSEVGSDWFKVDKILKLKKSYSIKLINEKDYPKLVDRMVTVYGLCNKSEIEFSIESYWIDKFLGEAIIKDNDKQRESKA